VSALGDSGGLEARVRGAEVMLRIRLARRARLRAWIWGSGLVLGAVALPTLAVWAADLTPKGGLRMLTSSVGVGFSVTLLFAGILGLFAFGALGVWLFQQVFVEVALLFILPANVLKPIWRRQAEQLLETTGEVAASWAGRSRARREVLEALRREDEALRLEAGRLTVRESLAPSVGCSTCGAVLRAVGQGLRRCDHCRTERYDELEGAGAALERARSGLPGGVVAAARSRAGIFWRALWSRLGEARSLSRKTAYLLGAQVSLALAADGVHRVLGRPFRPLELTLGSVAALLGLPLVVLAGMLLLQWAEALAETVGGWLELDSVLHGELVRLLFQHGKLPEAELAGLLGVGEALLRQWLAGLEAAGQLPVYRDRERRTLFALAVEGAAESRCPACGGETSPAPRGLKRCTHCGAEAMGRALVQLA
jgi:hypothetical protein